MIDGSKMEVQTKGGFAWGQWTTIIVTSNYAPQTLYDAVKNEWTVPPSDPGPMQRRYQTGGIHHGTGVYKNGTAKWDPALPKVNRPEDGKQEQDAGAAPDDSASETEEYESDYSPMEDILPRTPGTALPAEGTIDLTQDEVDELLDEIF